MKKSELKQLIKEQILKEDVYWGPKEPKEKTEDDIQIKAEEYIEDQIGLDSASVIVRYGGDIIEVYTKNKNAQPDPMMEQEWEEIGIGLADFLADNGVWGYKLTGWNYRMCRLTKD